MATGITKRDIDMWHRKGNNWRKEGKRVKKGTRLNGNINGDYFYPTPDTRTKKAWIAFDTVVSPPPVEPPPPPTQPTRDYFMVPHDRMRFNYDKKENGGWRLNPARNGLARETSRKNGTQPEVYKVEPEHSTKLTEAHIKLLVDINYELTETHARRLLNDSLAWCNRNYGVFDMSRLCGGAIITGTGRGTGTIHIRGLLLNDPIPTAAQVLADRTLWYYGTGVQPDGDVNYIQKMGKDGNLHPVKMFILSRLPLTVPENELLYLGTEFPANYDPRAMR